MDVADGLECMRTTVGISVEEKRQPEYIGDSLVPCYMLQLRDVLFVSVLPSTPW